MLTERQIDALPKGEFSNRMLRSVFGRRHGSPVVERFTGKNGQFDIEIIGNRRQKRYRRRHPLRPLKRISRSGFPGIRDIYALKAEQLKMKLKNLWIKILGRVGAFFGLFFGRGSSGQ